MPRKKRAEGTRAPNGASSIYLGKDGRWHGRVTVGVRDDGDRTAAMSHGRRRRRRSMPCARSNGSATPVWSPELAGRGR